MYFKITSTVYPNCKPHFSEEKMMCTVYESRMKNDDNKIRLLMYFGGAGSGLVVSAGFVLIYIITKRYVSSI